MGGAYARRRLHLGGKYSDLTVTCNYKQWAVHRAILCSRSGFFDGACSSQFREASTGVIDLSDDDEEAVEQMIHYFYHLDYLTEPTTAPSAIFRHRAYSNRRRDLRKKLDLSQVEDPLLAQAGYCGPQQPQGPLTPPHTSNGYDFAGKGPQSPRSPKQRNRTPPLDVDSDSDEYESVDDEEEDTEAESHLLLHTKVYALAEKYDIPSLKPLAKRKFEMAMACYYDSPEFADAIEEVYDSTPDSDRGLRNIVLQAFKMHPQLANTQDVYSVIKSTPCLAAELFKLERGLPI
ncbi:hypothetical protein MBLNU230_g6971t1 [Neophaeotheca triangularis]